jgi:hypothetical protein
MGKAYKALVAVGFLLSLILATWPIALGEAQDSQRPGALDQWQRHLIDRLPERAIFVAAGDIDADGRKDLIAGGWWWKNPGKLGGSWKRYIIGKPLRNMAVVYDFDGDGDLDLLGTQGVGSSKSNKFVWARNNGKGKFAILDNINTGGNGDFLQGCTVIDLRTVKQVVLSWHNGGGGLQSLTIPSKPSDARWAFSTLSQTTLKEDISVGDIDRDGDSDLLLGTIWLRNDISIATRVSSNRLWTPLTLGSVTQGEPDRVDLADVNGDGRLDATVGLEKGTDLLWFEAPLDPAKKWKRHIMGTIAGQGFSMDTADFDSDGDPDVVVGEHRGKTNNRVVIFENTEKGKSWLQHVIDSGPKNMIDHHDGTQAVDLDGDGDLDIISIGWYNPKLWVYENK